MNLPRFGRLPLISAGSLLFAGIAGCTSASNQTATTANNRPLGTSYGSTQYRRPGLQSTGPQYTGPQYTGPQFNPGPAQDPGYAADEFPDFRGNRKRFATGDGNAPPSQSDTEINEPARLPNEDEAAGADSADRRSFRETMHQKMSGLWHRRSSGSPENGAQASNAGGAATPGWNVRIDDNLVARAGTANARLDQAAASDTGVIDLDAPLEKPQGRQLPRQSPGQRLTQGIGPQERREQLAALRRTLAPDERGIAAANVGFGSSSPAGARYGSDGQALSARPRPTTSERPPEWSDHLVSAPTALPVSERRNQSEGSSTESGGLAARGSAPVPRPTDYLATEESAAGRFTAAAEPVRMADPPRLSVPPSGGDREAGDESAASLAVSRMVLCRQVRGFDDVAEIQPQQLRRGQLVLIYAALDNFLSVATAKGYRTLTLSTLEIRRPDGDVVLRMPLGTAVDVSESPRQDFFLTHRISIPENLPAGEYILSLRIDDLQAHESSRSQLAVTVTGDHTRPDAAGDTSKFAIRPDSIQR